MAVLGVISVGIAARTGKFKKDMQTAGKAVATFRIGIDSMSQKITAAATAFTAIRSAISDVVRLVGKVGSALRASADFADSIQKTSQKLNIGIQDLQKWRVAAELSGVEARTFDMALQRMTRRVSEAARGTGEAQAAIRELGLDARAMMRMRPDQQLLEIAKAMEGVGSQADKVRLAFKLFDSEGVALVNLVGQGAAAVGALTAEAERLGLVLSQDAIQQLVLAKDQMALLETRTKILRATLASALAPVLNAVADLMLDVGSDGIVSVEGITSAIDGLIERLAKVGDWFVRLQGMFAMLVGQIQKMAGNLAAQVAGWFAEIAKHLAFLDVPGARGAASMLKASQRQFLADAVAADELLVGGLAMEDRGASGGVSRDIMAAIDEQRRRARTQVPAGGFDPGKFHDQLDDIHKEQRTTNDILERSLSQAQFPVGKFDEMIRHLGRLRSTA